MYTVCIWIKYKALRITQGHARQYRGGVHMTSWCAKRLRSLKQGQKLNPNRNKVDTVNRDSSDTIHRF